MLEGGPSPAAPASLLAGHPELTVLCDRAAAARLTPSHHWRSDRAVVVLGHREPGISTEHAISEHSRARLRRAEELCLGDDVRAVVLTGYTHTGGLSEAEQMGREWVVADVPTLLEVAGRDTAENASRSLPILLATGAIRRVAVVTSAWHVRAPFFFAPYRRLRAQGRRRPRRAAAGLGAPPRRRARGRRPCAATSAGGLRRRGPAGRRRPLGAVPRRLEQQPLLGGGDEPARAVDGVHVHRDRVDAGADEQVGVLGVHGRRLAADRRLQAEPRGRAGSARAGSR